VKANFFLRLFAGVSVEEADVLVKQGSEDSSNDKAYNYAGFNNDIR
jgi:hypothetical protein